MEEKGNINEINSYKILIIFLFVEIKQYFCNILQKEEDVSAGIAAIRTLMQIITQYKCRHFCFSFLQSLFNLFHFS